MKFLLIFLVSAALIFMLLWMYPAHIFDSVVSGQGEELGVQLSLKSVFLQKDFPETVNASNVESVRPAFTGYFMMFICLVGLPAMIAWRFSLKPKVKSEE